MKKLLTMHFAFTFSIFFFFFWPKWQEMEVETVLLNAHRVTFQRPRFPDKVKGGTRKTDTSRAQKPPPTKINSNRLNFQRSINDSHQSNSISEK